LQIEVERREMPLTIDNELIERFTLQLGKAQKIAIMSHANPDGDAVGASLGLYNWLRSSFYAGATMPDVAVILPHPKPAETTYLPASEVIINAADDMELCENKILDADLVIAVDFNNAKRVESLETALTKSTAMKVVIDHHHGPDDNLFDTIISFPDLSSTCELLYWVFAQAISDSSINTDTARCLFHGINTDTGCFAYANEDASLYEAAAALMRHPVGAADVHNRTYNNYSVTKMRLLAFLLSERLKIFEEVGFAYLYITADDLRRHGGTAEDLEGLVNYTLMMQPMMVGAMVKETDGKVRISFRAKEDFDVCSFASRHFAGGGHTKASGATSPYDFDTTIQILEREMIKELTAHSKKRKR